MSDSNDTIVFEEPVDNGYEVEVLAPGESAPVAPTLEEAAAALKGNKIELTPEEYQALMAKGDSSAQLGNSLKEMVAKLSGQPAANTPQAVPDTYNPETLETQMFEAGKSVKTVESIAQRVMAQGQSAMAQTIIQQNKKILQLDPKTSELFKQFEGEVEKKIAALPMQYRMMPDIYEKAFQQVMIENQNAVIEMQVKKRVETLMAAGKKAETPAPKAGPLRNEQGTILPPTVKAGPTKLYLTVSGKQEMMEKFMDPTDPNQVRAYLDGKKGR
jgi:hypothetical protein